MSAERTNKTLLAQAFVWDDKLNPSSKHLFTTFDSKKNCSFCTNSVQNVHVKGDQNYCAVCFVDNFCSLKMVNEELRYVVEEGVETTRQNFGLSKGLTSILESI